MVVFFRQGKVIFACIPKWNIYGYGFSKEEACKSLTVMLKENFAFVTWEIRKTRRNVMGKGWKNHN